MSNLVPKPELSSEWIRITEVKSKEGKRWDVSLHISIVRVVDRETGQITLYIPSLEISGYGENIDKADIMLRHQVQDFFQYLADNHKHDIRTELLRYGWRRTSIDRHRFSNAFIDKEGLLQGLEGEDAVVEQNSLAIAV